MQPAVITPELGCMYRWNTEVSCLEYAPAMADGSYQEFCLVEEDMIGEEIVTFLGMQRPFSEAYRIIERQLGVYRGEKI